MENTVAQVSTDVPTTHSRSIITWVFLTILLGISTGLGGFYLGQQTRTVQNTSFQNSSQSPTINVENTSQTKNSEASNSSTSLDWKRTNVLGNLTFEYPTGWHVVALWPDGDREEGILVKINQEPIRTAPVGASLDSLFFVQLNGLINPEVTLQQKITDFKKSVQDMSESQITGKSGRITIIKGETDIYNILTPIEGYFSIIPAENTNDKFNYQVISATIASESKNSPILRHIMESIQPL